MPRQLTAYGNLQAGKLAVAERGQFNNGLAAMPDGIVSITVAVVGKQRSTQQSRYYFGVVVPIIQDCINDAQGEEFDKEEVHEWLKKEFNSREIETENGHSLTIAQSTKRLDTVEFGAYIERCRQWCASFFGVAIPDPEKITNAKTELRV